MPELGLLGSVRKTSATVKGRPAMKGKHRLAAFTLAAKSLWQTALKASVSVSALFAASPAFAQGMDGARISMPFGGSVGAFEVIQFSIFLGAMGAALLSAGWLIRDRSKIANENNELRSKFADLNLIAQRNEALLNMKDQRIVVWDGHNVRADVVGQLPDAAARRRIGRLFSPSGAGCVRNR